MIAFCQKNAIRTCLDNWYLLSKQKVLLLLNFQAAWIYDLLLICVIFCYYFVDKLNECIFAVCLGILQKSPNFQSFKKPMTMNQPNSTISFQYIGKILLAFAFMFLLGGIFTFFLENLPAMNLSAVSSL